MSNQFVGFHPGMLNARVVRGGATGNPMIANSRLSNVRKDIIMSRSTSNSNIRGNTTNRKVRKLWLLKEFGNGKRAPCCMDWHAENCPGYVTFETMTVDRHPVAGTEGGRYVRGNIRPAWGTCNYADGGAKGAAQKAKR